MWRSVSSVRQRLMKLWKRLVRWSIDKTDKWTFAGQEDSGKVNPDDLRFEPDEDERMLTREDIGEFGRRCAQFPEVPLNG